MAGGDGRHNIGQPDGDGEVILHPLDTSSPVPPRTPAQLAGEALMLLPNVAKLLYRLSRDDRVPLRTRVTLGLVAAYLVSPIDFIPDGVPVIGGLGDLLLAAFAVDRLLQSSPDEVVTEHWDGTEDGLELVRGSAAWGVELLPQPLRRVATAR